MTSKAVLSCILSHSLFVFTRILLCSHKYGYGVYNNASDDRRAREPMHRGFSSEVLVAERYDIAPAVNRPLH